MAARGVHTHFPTPLEGRFRKPQGECCILPLSDAPPAEGRRRPEACGGSRGAGGADGMPTDRTVSPAQATVP